MAFRRPPFLIWLFAFTFYLFSIVSHCKNIISQIIQPFLLVFESDFKLAYNIRLFKLGID